LATKADLACAGEAIEPDVGANIHYRITRLQQRETHPQVWFGIRVQLGEEPTVMPSPAGPALVQFNSL